MTDVMTDPRLMEKAEVQHFLDNVGQNSFVVIFLTKKGEQRKYTGQLIPSNTANKDLVPFQTEDAVKSFRLDSVLSISFA